MLLSLNNVTREFDNGRIRSLNDVSLQVRKGETIALLGRSGSGKTTLLNIATGLDAPDAGHVCWDGNKVTQRSQWNAIRRNRVGIIFQDFHLFSILSAIQNIQLPLLGGGLPRHQQRALAQSALEQVGLAHRKNHRASDLSGGERQRVAIARALLHGPALLTADEPTGSLDTRNGDAIADLLFGLSQSHNLALLIVTHDQVLARRCSRVVTMSDGRIAGGDR